MSVYLLVKGLLGGSSGGGRVGVGGLLLSVG